MNTSRTKRPASCLLGIATLFLVIGSAGCSRDIAATTQPAVPAAPSAIDPLAIVLASHAGDNPVDVRIRDYQGQVRSNLNREVAIERLGWLYVTKARESFDAGFYLLAEQCALALERGHPNSPAARLLLGHALHSQHRFVEAEVVARELSNSRGIAADFGLLGDVLIDVGRVDEAAESYQAMLDLKPDPQGYARAAHLRWIRGDLEGAIEVMRMAVAGVSMRDRESAAWMHTQLARLTWQTGTNDEAGLLIETALKLQADYPPALLLRGRMLLAAGNATGAIVPLERAAQLNPLPEYQWALAEALRAKGGVADAEAVERLIVARGPASDARGCSIFLATRRENSDLAVKLAERELSERADIFSHDALAWALAAKGEWMNAAVHMKAALAHETPEPRLWLHAGVIAFHTSQRGDALRWLRQAEQAKARLLPGETERLREIMELANATALNSKP